MAVVSEADVRLYIPDYIKVTSKNEVFYNPTMSFNRDISLLYLSLLPKDTAVLCGMAGSGVRAIRYAKSGYGRVTANDINPRAYELIMRNASENSVSIAATNMDFNLMEGKYGAIDIDPFGAPSRYLHPAFRLFGKVGHLAVTATDTAALCGSSKSACVRKYSAYPMKTSYCHEIGLRIMIGFIARQAAIWGYGIYPKVCYYKDHYMRAHVMVEKGKRRADGALGSLGFLHHCDKCKNRFFDLRPSSRCACGGNLRIAHPVWGGALVDRESIENMLKNADSVHLHERGRVEGFLGVLSQEVDSPYYWDSHELFSQFKLHVPPLQEILDAIEANGFSASRTHFNPMGFKTDAGLGELDQMFSEK